MHVYSSFDENFSVFFQNFESEFTVQEIEFLATDAIYTMCVEV